MTAHQPGTGTGPLGPGAEAPAFALRDSPHSRVGLDDFDGRAIVLVFYVADWDPVAATQLRLLEELRPHLDRLGADVIGVSLDTVWSHSAFADAHGIGYHLLADDEPPGAVARAYGVLASEAGRSRRALFVIGVDRTIRWSAAFPDMIDPGASGILAALESMAATDPLPPVPAADSARMPLCPCGCGVMAAMTSSA